MAPALALGQAVHTIIESLSILPARERLNKSLLEQFSAVWETVSGEKGGFKDREEEQQYKNRGAEMIKRVMQNPGPILRKAVKIKDDLPHYHLSVSDNIILCGKIDWLEYIPEGNSVHIIDFKTGRRDEDGNSLQLPIYYLLVTHCQKRTVSGASYWYLDRDNGLKPVALPDPDDAYERVLHVAHQIKNARMLRQYSCRKNGCFACKPMEEIIAGRARHVGLDQYNREVYTASR